MEATNAKNYRLVSPPGAHRPRSPGEGARTKKKMVDELIEAGILRAFDAVADVRVERAGSVRIAGLLCFDPECESPLDSCDGMGRIERLSRREGLPSLALEGEGRPDYSSIEEEARAILIERLKREAPASTAAFVVECGAEGTSREEAIEEMAYLLVGGRTDGLACGSERLPEWEDCLRDAWRQCLDEGLIGDPFAVPLSIIQRGWNEKASLCEPLEANAAWTPDPCLERELKEARKRLGLKEAKAMARRFAAEAIEAWNEWAAGECYGVRVLVIGRAPDGDPYVLDEESVWGFIGRAAAEEELVSMMAAARERFRARKAA